MFLYLGTPYKELGCWFQFHRIQTTVSKHFHECLKVIIKYQKEFWKTPEPVMENPTDPKWK